LIRFIARGLVFVAIVFGLISFVSYLQSGRFWVPKTTSTLPAWLPFVEPNPHPQSLGSPKEKIYKWQEDGQWIYGPTPPDDVSAELVGEEN